MADQSVHLRYPIKETKELFSQLQSLSKYLSVLHLCVFLVSKSNQLAAIENKIQKESDPL
jgi:hypothetical protein